MINGKYSALKGATLGVIILLMVLDVIFTAYEGGTQFTRWANLLVTLCFGTGLVKVLWDKWKVKE